MNLGPKRARGGRAAITLFGVVAATATLVVSAGEARAYCRTSSCPDKVIGSECLPAMDGDCGVPLFWPNPCTGFTVQKDSAEGITDKTVEDLAKQAFASWTTADCGAGQHPKMRVDDLGFVSCNEPEYNQTLANSNTIMFRSDGWPYSSTNTIALTTVTFNVDTGEIRDADMELNATDVTFSTSDTNITFDLLSILTHETGHFLGMAHSPVPDATMEAAYPPMSTELRSLAPDDIAGICAIYPPGTVPDSCDSTPKNGLGDECKSPVVTTPSGCCAVAPGSRPENGEGSDVALFALALGCLVTGARIAARRRGARRQRGSFGRKTKSQRLTRFAT